MQCKIKQWFTVLLALMMAFTTLPVTAMAESVIPTEETKIKQVQALIDELPEVDAITDDNRVDVQAQIDAIAEAMPDLTEDEAAELDTTHYDAAVAALQALDGSTGNDGAEANADPDADIDIDASNSLDTSTDSVLSALKQVQSLIDALPEADSIMDDNRENVELQLSAIDEKKLSLTDDERAMLDTARYEASVSAILALDGQAGADVPTPIANSSGSVDGFEWTFDDVSKTLTLTGDGDLDFDGEAHPWTDSEVEMLVVRGDVFSIGRNCFRDWVNLRDVILPEGLMIIENGAFEYCRNLTYVNLPESVIVIEDNAFSGCDHLARIKLSDELERLGDRAFFHCSNLELEKLPENLKDIGNGTFLDCYQLSITELPEELEYIGGYAFANCGSLTALEIPASVEEIESYAFQNCNDLVLSFSRETAPTLEEGALDTVKEIQVPIGSIGYDAANGWPEDKIQYIFSDGGTEENPYLIRDKAQLEAFRGYINGGSGSGEHFKLTADIDLEDELWSPIGTFAGTFDGGDHTIRGLYIEGTSGLKNEYLGFFRVIGQGGTVKNLTVAGSVTGGSYAGGVAGENEGTVENCRNTCTVSAPDGYGHAGGIAGCNIGGYSTVKNCSNTGAVTGYTAGGIAGQNETTVEGCSNAGLVTGDCVGGIVGTDLEGTIKNCSNAGTVSGNSACGIVNDLYDTAVENCYNTGTVDGKYASGITGLTFGTIKNCYNTGAVSGSEAAAGIVRGSYESTVENCYNTGAVTGKTAGGVAITNEDAAIKNCYNTGAVTGETTGGVVADNLGGVVENCYYLDACGGAGEGTPKTAAQFASGEVAWLLQNGQDPQAWGQTVGSGAPELTDSAEKTVYRITGEVEGQDSLVWYSNREATLPAAPARAGYAFEGWSTTDGGSVDFTAGVTVSADMTVYAVFMDKKADGTGSVTMADYTCGDDSVEPVAVSATNGTANVTFTYSVKGKNDYSAVKPAAAGEYTVKAVFAETEDYHEVTATADFKITHQFNAGWEQREDGEYLLCVCGVWLRLETTALTEVPEGLKGNPAVDTVEKIGRVLAEKVDTGDHYVIHDVELAAWIGGERQIITPENFPDEGVAITMPYPEGTNARYTFTVVHMFTTTGDGHVPGDTEILKATNEPDGIHFTVKSLSPIAIGWKTGNLTVTVTDTGEGTDPAQQWQFRVELDVTEINGQYGDMRFTDGVAEFTLGSGQSFTARALPEGVAYTVTERNGNQNGYTTTYTDDSGFITSEQDMVAAFINDKPAPAQQDDPSDDSDNPPDELIDNSPDDPAENESVKIPKTGDESHLTLWFSLMILSLIGIAAIVLTSIIRRKNLVSTNGRHRRK